MTADEQAILWLSECSGLDRRQQSELLHITPRPSEIFGNFEKFSENVLKDGQSGLYITERAFREKQLADLTVRLQSKKRFAVTIVSEDYPALLKEIPDPPLVLYGEGNRALLRERSFTVVGSRITPAWADKTGRLIAERLTQAFTVVTGFAEGGDCAAIDGAIDRGKLICVLPCGLDECYPAAHVSLKRKVREKGLLLSEFPFRERVKKHSFHARNRILAGFSEGVFVISAGEKSGALITANLAVDYNRDVFALPYNAGTAQGAGCNGLIKAGAFLVTDADDILSVYGIEPEQRQKPQLTEKEEKILVVLRESGQLHTAVVAERAGIRIYEAAAILSSLEIRGFVVKAGGNQYCAL